MASDDDDVDWKQLNKRAFYTYAGIGQIAVRTASYPFFVVKTREQVQVVSKLFCFLYSSA
jgi:molybdopterin/thiamine biosynthesis adenylyltransferase